MFRQSPTAIMLPQPPAGPDSLAGLNWRLGLSNRMRCRQWLLDFMIYGTTGARAVLHHPAFASKVPVAVSHEFRTPLTPIRQLTELLASGRIENPDKASAYYRVLDKESRRLQRLVEGLLDFGRMEAGAHPYHPEKLDCSALLVSQSQDLPTLKVKKITT